MLTGLGVTADLTVLVYLIVLLFQVEQIQGLHATSDLERASRASGG